jgi:hypothetical protein
MEKTATETFQLIKQAYVTRLSLVHRFLNGMQDFGTGLKISKMTNAVDNQQPFEHLT